MTLWLTTLRTHWRHDCERHSISVRWASRCAARNSAESIPTPRTRRSKPCWSPGSKRARAPSTATAGAVPSPGRRHVPEPRRSRAPAHRHGPPGARLSVCAGRRLGGVGPHRTPTHARRRSRGARRRRSATPRLSSATSRGAVGVSSRRSNRTSRGAWRPSGSRSQVKMSEGRSSTCYSPLPGSKPRSWPRRSRSRPYQALVYRSLGSAISLP